MQYFKYIPLFLFSSFAVKCLFLGASWTDAAALGVLGAISAFWEYKSQDRKLDAIAKTLEKQNEVILAYAKALDDVRTSLSSVKLAQGMESSNVGRL